MKKKKKKLTERVASSYKDGLGTGGRLLDNRKKNKKTKELGEKEKIRKSLFD